MSPHPISATYLDLQEARASAVLPAASAWDAAPTEMVCCGFDQCNLHLTYTRGAAGGAVDFQIEVSPYSVAALVPAGAQEWITESMYAAGGVVSGVDTQSLIQRAYETYQSQGAAAEDFEYGPIHLAANIERIRIRARENPTIGVTGNPGTLQIEATFSSKQ